MKKLTIVLLMLTCVACAKKAANNSSNSSNPAPGTMTESKGGGDSQPGAASTTNDGPRDLTGTWIATQPGETWELVVTRTSANSFAGSSTLVQTNDPKGIDGPVGTKGDDIVIVSDEPGKFRVRWAKAQNFHGTEFWNGTGTYDDNTFDFAGYYKGKRKS
jgi:hypothetical protein